MHQLHHPVAPDKDIQLAHKAKQFAEQLTKHWLSNWHVHEQLGWAQTFVWHVVLDFFDVCSQMLHHTVALTCAA